MDSVKWLSDDPIKSHKEDLLNFDKASVVLEKMIVDCDTPFSIGINGDWGSGKTSFMRLIKEKIDKKSYSNIKTSWFDTWNYTNEKEIWKMLMISLIDDLDPDNKSIVDTDKLITSVLSLGIIASTAYVTSGSSLYGDRFNVVSSLRDLFNAKKNRDESIIRDKVKSIKSFRSDFERLVDSSLDGNGKYIIFIDDLDRISPEKAMDVIESIKIFLSCKKCVFIIGCDYNYLDACFESKYEDIGFCGKDYIEKIVQITFDVPALNVHNFNLFLSYYLNPFFVTKEDFQAVSYLISKSLGKNPRKIKRLINLYSIVHHLNYNGLDNCLLLKLLCFMERWPEFHNRFLEDFHDGLYTYKKYEKWALPLESFEQFIDYDYDPCWDFDESNISPPDEEEAYNEYVKDKKKIDEEINKELESGIKNPEDQLLKIFLSSPPLLPHSIKKLAPYLSLVGSIDLTTVKTEEEHAINNLPSVWDIDKVVDELIGLFNGQSVNGEYFNIEGKVTLPEKIKIQKRPVGGSFNIEGWKCTTLEHKWDDKRYFRLIDKFETNSYDILWAISPWVFPKSVRDYAKNKENIYLTSYYSLQDLLKELKQK